MSRPELNDNISVDDFTSFYWLKEELVAFCRINGMSAAGSKIDIAERIKHFLISGEIPVFAKTGTNKARSKFNWSTAVLSLNTVLTDNYKSTENVRRFLISQIGHFYFTVDFMKWAKQSAGKTLGDAVKEWTRQYNLKKDKHHTSDIAPQFEYNRYMRAFLADNPGKKTKEAMKYWKLKKALRGSNEYEKSDLLLRSPS